MSKVLDWAAGPKDFTEEDNAMGEGDNTKILLLLGKVSADVEEAKTQRSSQWELLNTLNQQITEFSTLFNQHVQTEEGKVGEWAEWQRLASRRLERLEHANLVRDTTEKVEEKLEESPKKWGKLGAMVAGGGGLYGLFFGSETWDWLAELLKNLRHHG